MPSLPAAIVPLLCSGQLNPNSNRYNNGSSPVHLL